MNNYAIAGVAICTAILLAAWMEYRADNRRDAGLLAFIGFTGLVASLVLNIVIA